MHDFWNFILTVTGSNDTTGVWYGFWSGFGSDLGELAILGSLLAAYRRHKCAACWRIASHPVKGTHYKTCHKHLTQKDHQKLHHKHNRQYPEQHDFLKDV